MINESLWLKARDGARDESDIITRYKKMGGKVIAAQPISIDEEYLQILRAGLDNSKDIFEVEELRREIRAVEENIPPVEEKEEKDEDVVIAEPPKKEIPQNVEKEPEKRAEDIRSMILDFKGTIRDVVKAIYKVELSSDELKAITQKMINDITSYLGDVTNNRLEELMGEDIIPLSRGGK